MNGMNTKTTFDWLVAHARKSMTPVEWASLLGVKIIDADGWRHNNINNPCGIVEFIERVSRCTIQAPIA